MILLILFAFICISIPAQSAEIDIDTNVKYQEIMGFGSASWYPERLNSDYKNEIIREYIFDMGINRLRLEIPGGNKSNTRRWEWLNDDGDPYNINWDEFNTEDFDEHIKNTIVPYNDYLKSIGSELDIYVSPSYFDGGSTGSAPAWLINSPAEYAEHALALLLRLKEVSGIEAKYYCILNEAGNNNAFTAKIVADMIRELGPRIRDAGLNTKIQFPESISANASWNYIKATKDDPDIWQYVGLISYHLYGVNDPIRDSIRIFAEQMGIPTAQTEYMSLNINVFYDDLIKGGVSYWEIYGVSSCMNITYDKISKNANYWNFRQIMHFVPPGSTRIKASSNDSTVKALAFLKEGKTTLILINDKNTKSINISGLQSGNYGVSYSVNGSYTESGMSNSPTGTLQLSLPANAVMTVYPYQGSNLPPVPVYWRAEPEYIYLPSASVKLQANAADPEKEAITYEWSLAEKPAGANPAIETPQGRETNVSGLDKSGRYLFKVNISDGKSTISRDVRLEVFPGNNPPDLLDLHNRIPVLVTLPVDTTILRAGSWDAENDKIKYKWEVVSQPDGAHAQLLTPDTNTCKVKSMSIAGNYIFSISANDGKISVSDTLIVPVYPVNNAPVINTITATPSKVFMPVDSTVLDAEVTDGDNDLLTYWWSVKSAPAGAKPVIVKPGSKSTIVRNLNLPGDYTLTLTAIDASKKASKDVKITVSMPNSAGEDFGIPGLSVYPNPFKIGRASCRERV